MTVPTNTSEEALQFSCTDGNEHRIGQRYDERRGVGNGPQICLHCNKTFMELIKAYGIQQRLFGLELLKGEYFGVIGLINSSSPSQPITSNALCNRIDEIIAQLKAQSPEKE